MNNIIEIYYLLILKFEFMSDTYQYMKLTDKAKGLLDGMGSFIEESLESKNLSMAAKPISDLYI